MAQADGGKDSALIERLFNRGYEFEFFQAVRLLEFLAAEEGRRALTGQANSPREESIRFGVPATTSFPPGAVAEIRRGNVREGTGQDQSDPVQMSVSFMGLTGPSGVLPQHYASLAVTRSHAGDHTLREFLNILHHRAIAFFFEAWRKYRFPFAYEAFRLGGETERTHQEDLFTFCLRSLVGLGTKRLASRMAVDDQAIFYYSGYYSQQVRSAIGLDSLLGDYFGLPVQVKQFHGRWINLPADQQTSLPTKSKPQGQYCSLGRETIVGSRIWDVQSAFRIRLGPVGYAMFQQFMPAGQAMKKLCDLVRLYVGPSLSFDIQPVLRKEEVPRTQLGRPAPGGSRLGWNTWLRGRAMKEDAEGAVFRSLDAALSS